MQIKNFLKVLLFFSFLYLPFGSFAYDIPAEERPRSDTDYIIDEQNPNALILRSLDVLDEELETGLKDPSVKEDHYLNGHDLKETAIYSVRYYTKDKNHQLNTQNSNFYHREFASLWEKILLAQIDGSTIEGSILSESEHFSAKLYYDITASPYLVIEELSTGNIYYNTIYNDGHIYHLQKAKTPSFTFEAIDQNKENPVSLSEFAHLYSKLPESEKDNFKKHVEIFKRVTQNVVDEAQEVAEMFAQIRSLEAETLKEERAKITDGQDINFQTFIAEFIKTDKINLQWEKGSAGVNAVGDDETGYDIFYRIVHKKSEKSYLFYLKKDYHPNSKAQQLYIARQRVLSGLAREDGEFGRDVFVVVLNEEEWRDITAADILEAPEAYWFPRHSVTFNMKSVLKSVISPTTTLPAMYDWFKDYLKATWVNPNKATGTFGLACGTLQIGLSVGMALLLTNKDLTSSTRAVTGSIVLPLIWGSGIGIFIKSYKAIVNHGTVLSRFLKNAAVSYGYYMLYIWTQSGMAGFTFEAVGRMVWTLIIQNMSKPSWYAPAIARERASLNKTNWKLHSKLSDEWWLWSKADTEQQLIYLFPFVIKHLAIMGTMWGPVDLSVTSLLVSTVLATKFAAYISDLMAKAYPDNLKSQEYAQVNRLIWEHSKMFFTSKTVLGLTLKKWGLWFKTLVNRDAIPIYKQTEQKIVNYIQETQKIGPYAPLEDLEQHFSWFDRFVLKAFGATPQRRSETMIRHLQQNQTRVFANQQALDKMNKMATENDKQWPENDPIDPNTINSDCATELKAAFINVKD